MRRRSNRHVFGRHVQAFEHYLARRRFDQAVDHL